MDDLVLDKTRLAEYAEVKKQFLVTKPQDKRKLGLMKLEW